jgi:phasin
MNANTKQKSSNTNTPHQLRDMTETGAEQSREAFEKFGSATTEAAEAMTKSCSTALRGIQDYSGKVVEFTQSNAKSHVEFLQRLAGVKSPSEFLELSTEQARNQLEKMAEQARELTALAQQVTIASAEPLKMGLAKAYDRKA